MFPIQFVLLPNKQTPPCGIYHSRADEKAHTHYWDPESSGYQRKQAAVEVTVIEMRHNSTLQVSNMSIPILEIYNMPPILSWLVSLTILRGHTLVS